MQRRLNNDRAKCLFQTAWRHLLKSRGAEIIISMSTRFMRICCRYFFTDGFSFVSLCFFPYPTVVTFSIEALLPVILIETSPIVSVNVLRYKVGRLYCVVSRFVTILWYTIAEFVFFADVSDYPIDDVFVFIRLIFASPTGCTVFR